MIQIFTDLQPLWMMQFSGRVSGEDIKSVAAMVAEMHSKPASALIVDAREAGFPDATTRGSFGALASSAEANGRGRTLAVSVLLQPGPLSKALRAILWFAPGIEPGLLKLCPTVDSAFAHIETRAPGLIDESTATLARRVLSPSKDAAGLHVAAQQ